MEEEIQKIWNEICVSFDKMRDNPLKKLFAKYQNVYFLCHGDPDGIMSFVMLYQPLHKYYENVEFGFTQPYEIHQHIDSCEVYDLIVCLDLAIDNRNDKNALKFLEKYKSKLVWIDHHYSTVNHPNYINDDSFGSCVYFLKSLFPQFKYNKKVNEMIETAHRTDQGETTNRYNRALKINQKNDETRLEIFFYAKSLIGGNMERMTSIKINQKRDRYDNMEKNTLSLYNDTKRTKIYDLVTIIDNRDNRSQGIDKTLLAFTCYEKTPFMLYKFYSKPKMVRNEKGQMIEKRFEYNTITCDRRVTRTNIAKIFGYRSGAKYRITRPNFDKSFMTDKEYNEFLSEKHIPKNN